MALVKHNLNTAKNSTDEAIALQLNLPHDAKKLKEAFALPNLVSLELNVENGFCDIPESLKNAKQLKHVRIKDASKYKGNLELPKIFTELPQIEAFHIQSCPNLIIGEEAWEMPNLNELYIINSFKKFPKGLLAVRTLQFLKIEHCNYTEIPESIGDFDKISDLDLDLMACPAPEAIGRMKNLRYFSLKQESYPDWLSKCNPGLKMFRFSGKKKSPEIDEAIFNFSELDTLHICGIGLQSISPKIGNLKKLRILDLSKNKLNSVPETFIELKNLSELNLSHNDFVKIPGTLAKLKNLSNINLDSQPASSAFAEDFLKMKNRFFSQQIQIEQCRDIFCDIWDKKPFYSEMENWLFTALRSEVNPLDENALYYLTEKSGRTYIPLKAGDSLFLGSDTYMPKAAIKEKLEKLDIKLATKAEKATHILIDIGSNGYYNEACMMTEKQLIDLFNEKLPDYLYEASKSEPSSINALNEMLYSLDPQSIEVALNLILSGGLPPETMTALFTASRLCDKRDTCNKVTNILQKLASSELSSALRRKSDFGKLKYHTDFNTEIINFENTELDLLRFALEYSKKNRNEIAIQYILNKNNPHYSREFLKLISAEGALNLNLYYYEITEVPECLYELDHLSKLRLVVDPEVARTKLKSIEKLKKLESIELDDSLNQIINFAPEFMQSLSKLPNLKKIKIAGMSAETRAFLENALPKCIIE